MVQKFNHLFESIKLGNKVLKNRIFSTGHMTVMVQDGKPTDDMVAYHEARAKGGAGLIIIEAARAHPTGTSGCPAIRAYEDDCILGISELLKLLTNTIAKCSLSFHIRGAK